MREDRSKSRRDFLRSGAAAIGGVTLLPAASCTGPPPEESRKGGKLVYRILGRTGLRLPVVSMGSSYALDLFRAARDAGIVHFQTSSSYSERNHERMLGEALRGTPRDSFVIATAPDLPYEIDRSQNLSQDVGTTANPALIVESLEGSLQRLGLDHVDIYYLASVGRRLSMLHEPYLKAFEKVKKEGKTRFVGITTHSNEPDIIRTAAESGFWDIVLTAYNFRQSYRQEIRAAIDQAAKAGLGVVAMKTMAGVYWSRPLGRKINAKAALKWVLQDENVHTTIPAFSNYDEMRESLSVMDDLTLTPEEMKDLGLGQALGFSGYYCQQCGSCLPQCREGMNVPALMRAAMYAFGHERPKEALEGLRGWVPADVGCGRCDECGVRCALGLEVKSRAMAMARLIESPEALPG